MRRHKLLVIFSLIAFAAPALAKPSDWDDVVERPGDKSVLPAASQNAPDVVANAKSAKASKPKKERAAAKKKSKKAPRRGKAKRSRR